MLFLFKSSHGKKSIFFERAIFHVQQSEYRQWNKNENVLITTMEKIRVKKNSLRHDKVIFDHHSSFEK